MSNYPRTLTQADTSNTTYLKTITASVTTHTKGPWTQLHAATAFSGYLLEVYQEGSRLSGNDSSGLLDIGIDAAGGTAYTVIVPDIIAGHSQNGDRPDGRPTTFPVHIPAGSTVAARFQSTIVSGVIDVAVRIHGGIGDDPFPPQGLVVPYGLTTGTSSGTTPANANANVKGAWVQLVASTTHPHSGLSIQGQGADGSMTSDELLVDIGIGAASSEVVLVDNWWAHNGTGEHNWCSIPNPMFWRPIPEGSRLAVRAQGDVNNAQENFDIAVYGWG